MKKALLILSVLTLLLAMSLTAYAQTQYYSSPVNMVATTGVNYRSGPGTNYAKYGALSRGQTVQVVGIVNGWYQVPLQGGGYAYVWNEYLAPMGGGGYSTNQYSQSGRVCFFEHINYGGRSACWDSRARVSDLTQIWHQNMYWNDVISSVSFEGAAGVTVYEHINFGGASVHFSSNLYDLRYVKYQDGSQWNWNDVISSLIVD